MWMFKLSDIMKPERVTGDWHQKSHIFHFQRFESDGSLQVNFGTLDFQHLYDLHRWRFLTVLVRNRCIGHILYKLWILSIMFVKSSRISIFILVYTPFLMLHIVIVVWWFDHFFRFLLNIFCTAALFVANKDIHKSRPYFAIFISCKI